jgi:hypothetical protein
MSFHVQGGWDPLTKKQLDAEYHYEDDTLLLVRSASGVEIHMTHGRRGGKFFISMNGEEIIGNEYIKDCIFDAITIHLREKGVDLEQIKKMFDDADFSLIMRGDINNLTWGDDDD